MGVAYDTLVTGLFPIRLHPLFETKRKEGLDYLTGWLVVLKIQQLSTLNDPCVSQFAVSRIVGFEIQWLEPAFRLCCIGIDVLECDLGH